MFARVEGLLSELVETQQLQGSSRSTVVRLSSACSAQRVVSSRFRA
jgi:hypothetical protein